MSKCVDLLEEARESPKNFDFDDLCYLAECWGFEFQRQNGSHHLYKQEEFPYPDTQVTRKKFGRMNFQERGGQAKPYQVRQLLDAIDYYLDNFPDQV
jgi:hypothetical protein